MLRSVEIPAGRSRPKTTRTSGGARRSLARRHVLRRVAAHAGCDRDARRTGGAPRASSDCPPAMSCNSRTAWASRGRGDREIRRTSIDVATDAVRTVKRPTPIHFRAPVADRERMLWLAEKATELGVATWQAVRFRRSASVSPRGEGAAFHEKVRARMVSALEQSGGAWLPELMADTTVESCRSSRMRAHRSRFCW
jgi:hypothetical protein